MADVDEVSKAARDAEAACVGAAVEAKRLADVVPGTSSEGG